MAICGLSGHGGGVCRRWCKAKAVAVGKGCRRLRSVGGGEELYVSCVVVIAGRRKGQHQWR